MGEILCFFFKFNVINENVRYFEIFLYRYHALKSEIRDLQKAQNCGRPLQLCYIPSHHHVYWCSSVQCTEIGTPEKFFGLQRQRGRVNENPSVNEFLKNSQALRVIQSCASTVKGNCRGNTDVDPNELTPLHRRTRGRNDSL